MISRHIAALAAVLLMGTAPLAQAADKPTGPQIAHIAYTAGVIDVEAAKLAISKSKNSEVVGFAQSRWSRKTTRPSMCKRLTS